MADTAQLAALDHDTPPLTDWANEPTIRDLKQDLEDAAIDNESHQQDVERWLDNMAMEGQAKPVKVTGQSSVAPKVIRKQAEWRYSSLADPFLSSPDIFAVSPKSAGDRTRAQQNGLVLNHQFNTCVDKVAFIDSYVRDGVDIGTVLVEVGWITEEEEVTEEVPTYEFVASNDPRLAQRYMHLAQLRQTSQDLYHQYMNPGLDRAVTLFVQTGQLLEARQTGTESQTRMEETQNHPTVEVCEQANIIIDPSCNGELAKAQFVGKKFRSSLSELEKDGRYVNLDLITVTELEPHGSPDYKENSDLQSFTFKDKPRKQFDVHAYWGNWDIHGTGATVPIVASWVGNVMIRMEKNPFPFQRPPFAKAVYMPKRRSIFGEPDGELLEENQQIIGAVTRGMIDLMGKSANSQTGTKKGYLDATNKRKFKRGEDYEFNVQGDPRQSVFQHTFPEIPQSAFNLLSYENADVESMSGVKAFSNGINSQALGDSVGGGRDAMDAASKRESGILKRLAAGIREVGRMFLAMNAVFLSDEEVVRITDTEFVTVRRDDLAGNFDLRLSISTVEEDNKKAQELAFMLQTLGNNMDWGLQKMILSDIARLRKMPDVAKRLEEYEPQPDPLEQMKAQKELELLDAQIAKERSLEAKHNSEARANGARGFKDGTQGTLNQAKAETEGAKGRNLHSDSDNKDLDYLEKHAGVGHQRDLEKSDRQAANDLDAAVIKAGLDARNKGGTTA